MEWTMVTALTVLVGLGASVVKPIVSLTKSITALTVVVERVEKELAEQARHSQESHRRIWAKNEEQDGRLDEHERRIDRLEHRP